MTANHIPASDGYPGLVRYHDPKTGKHFACLGDPNLISDTVKKMIGERNV